MNTDTDVVEAIDEILIGKNVKRYVHELVVNGADLTELFLNRAKNVGFEQTTVSQVDIGFDERVAAFAVRKSTAYFGWVFIERFNAVKSRKVFGSIVLNKRGDWAIQIPSNSKESIFVNYSERLGMELGADFLLE